MPATHRLFIGLLLGISVVLPACSASDAQSPKPGASQPAVPVTVDRVVEKDMPLDANVVGTAEAFSTVAVRAQVTGELKTVNFNQGDDVQAGQVLFTLDHRPLEAALHQAEANLARNTAQAANAKVIAQRMDDLVERGVGTREQRDTARTTAAALEASVGADTRRCRKRESAAAVRDHTRADRRPHRRADGACRQSRARQRSDAARRHQPGEPDLRLVRHSRSVAARPAPLHGAAASSSVEALPPNEELDPANGQHHFRRQPGRPDDRHDPDQGHVPELEPAALAGSVRQRAA